MENRKTFISIWAKFLQERGLSNYQSIKSAIVFADQMEEVKNKLSAEIDYWKKMYEHLDKLTTT